MSLPIPPEPVESKDRTSRPPTEMVSRGPVAPPPPGPSVKWALWARVVRGARCADGRLDPDEWFPLSTEAVTARQQAATAITVCTACLVRSQCLEFSLRHWDIGKHGVWGGLVAADRERLRRRLHLGRRAAASSN